ncbi:hypothetical protein [Agromyces sp. LHK192]|uniref:hypothetical protein n=1 Tax=Agromyces sp. LHK192 TaxID=2498704 RepID=UPI000FDA0903|nr:hypothetical protein [Agromyces sp. LHK192]
MSDAPRRSGSPSAVAAQRAAAPAPDLAVSAAPQAAARSTSLGVGPGQPALGGSATARPLGTAGSVLPELAAAPERERRWWRHPAFLVSTILTVLALAGAATWYVISIVTDDSVRVSGLSIGVEGGNAHLDWDGPDAAYSLYAVHGDGEAVDLTQLVRGTDAWVMSAAGLYDDDTCFVVRPSSVDGEVAVDAATLDGQRAQSVCVADAQS